jgi:hypothetical protein
LGNGVNITSPLLAEVLLLGEKVPVKLDLLYEEFSDMLARIVLDLID